MMEIQDLKRNVNCLLAISGIRKDVEKEQLQLLFYHQLMTVSLFDSLTDEEREMVKKLNRRFKNFFASKFSVKERKARKEKKSLPQTPSKDIETERIDKETLSQTAGVRERFRQECLKFIGQYDEQQAQHAQERRQANERLEQEIEQRKQGAVSYKEYLEMKGEKEKNKGDHETG